MKVTICLIFLLFARIILTFDFKDQANNLSEIKQNPYRILKIAPWSSLKTIQNHYETIKDELSFEDKVQYEEAYNIIIMQRQTYQLSEEDTVPIFTILKELFGYVSIIELILGSIAFALWLLYKFQGWIASPLFYLILSFELTGKLIPHFFVNAIYQYIFALIAGLILFGMKELLIKWVQNRKGNSNNGKTKTKPK